MRPQRDLPIDQSWHSTDEYVDSLLQFISISELFRNLCGGVHILDFLTRKPDLYSWVLPQEWREWFELVTIDDVLDILLREDFDQFDGDKAQWRGRAVPPESLIEYVSTIRRHSLQRDFIPRKARQDLETLPRHVAVGMKPKKIHEVSQFAAFVDDLSQQLSSARQVPSSGSPLDPAHAETTTINESGQETKSPVIIDFGSGQNYLGRTLACPPYNKQVVAIEQRHHNMEGARGMDVSARLIKKQKNMVNKKEWKEQWEATRKKCQPCQTQSTIVMNGMNGVTEAELLDLTSRIPLLLDDPMDRNEHSEASKPLEAVATVATSSGLSVQTSTNGKESSANDDNDNSHEQPSSTGKILYVEKELSSGDLKEILDRSSPPSLVVSIHSCGNLTHHGLRSLVLNPSVKAVALIGCCYNLLTERLGPPTYKLPTLRSNHPRLEAISSAFDPHGFPMSKRLEDFTYPVLPAEAEASQAPNRGTPAKRYYNLNGDIQEIDVTGKGVRLNITARMMAVQAPHNWGPKDSEEFFTRHYYRALLQRILLDLGVVKMSTPASAPDIEIAGGTLSGRDETGSPLIIGSLRKACFASFEAYVRGAIEKLVKDPVDGHKIDEKTKVLFEDDGELLRKYEKDYAYAKKLLSVVWSLMAFSASLAESTILVDRWLWLKEQKEVEDAWVESVFDYKLSPRNMVVVGVKKPKG